MNKQEQIHFIQSTLCPPEDTFWALFHALGDCVRYRITKVMMYHRNMCVSDLAAICNVSVPAVSQHLRVLQKNGLVTKKQEGRTVYYELKADNPYLKQIVGVIDRYLNDEKRKEHV